MGLMSKLKKLIGGTSGSYPVPSGQQQIIISGRSDGFTTTSMPSHIASWVSSYPRTLKCSDGTDFPIRTTHSLITGTSVHKKEILSRQIVSAIHDGFTPVVLSNNGKQGEVYNILRTIYPEYAINYISDSCESGCYDPFGGVSYSLIADFFYQLATTFQQQPTNGMLVRNYINVCVKVLFANSNAISGLITGQLNHMSLLHEIQHMHQNGAITEQQKLQFEDTANTAQSVSVMVLSVIQDYLYKMQRVSASKPTIQIRSSNVPQITILRNDRQPLQPIQTAPARISGGFDSSVIREKKCMFLQIENDVPRGYTNSPNEQCFQWYLSRTFQMEISSKSEVKNGRILLIIENISALQLNWFWWLLELPNCVLLLNYDDLYSKLADASDNRQQLIGRMERIYFFSIMDEQSAGWASRIFGTHMIPKVIVTDQPHRDWKDIFFKPKAYAHDEVEKPWFSTHEIQHLGDNGIVYSKRDKVFTAYYRENGVTYKDKKYKGQRVNFCTFGFR